MHPIFLQLLQIYLAVITVIRVITMKNNQYFDLITQLSSLKQINSKIHPVMTLKSISKQSNCSTCNILIQVIDELNQKEEGTCDEYNKLLKQTQRLMELSYQFIEQQQLKYEEELQQIQKNNKQSYSKIEELQAEITEKGRKIMEYCNLLMEKEQYISFLEDRLEQQTKQANQNRCLVEVQLLKHHKRQKSQLCNKFQAMNTNLTIQNNQLRGQNEKLVQIIKQLEDYNKRMEEDLANINIKSPRIISQVINGDNDNAQQIYSHANFSGAFNSIHSHSILQHSPVQENHSNKQQTEQQYPEAESNQISVRQSFVQKSKPLRDVLNISGQTSSYFKFQTKQKIQEYNIDLISMSNNENVNSMNIIKNSEQKISMKNILQIKQFEVNDPISHRNYQKQKLQSKKNVVSVATQKEGFPTDINYMIDPYYAFFVLTIQCLKLNYKDMSKVANIQLYSQWDNLLKQNIPFNKWRSHLREILKKRVESIK